MFSNRGDFIHLSQAQLLMSGDVFIVLLGTLWALSRQRLGMLRERCLAALRAAAHHKESRMVLARCVHSAEVEKPCLNKQSWTRSLRLCHGKLQIGLYNLQH